MKLDYFGNLQLAKREYARLLEPVCARWGLTRAEADILLFLHNNPGLDRAADIVERRGLAKSQVSGGVAALEQKELLTRLEDDADRRAIHLHLTERGVEAAREARLAQRSFFTAIFAGLTQEEMAVWQGIMEKVTHNIQNLK